MPEYTFDEVIGKGSASAKLDAITDEVVKKFDEIDPAPAPQGRAVDNPIMQKETEANEEKETEIDTTATNTSKSKTKQKGLLDSIF